MTRSLFKSGILLVAFSCSSPQTQQKEKEIASFNQHLADELAQLAELDQTAAWIPDGKFKEYTQEQWKSYKDSVFTSNKKRAEAIFETYGYPGFDLVGTDGANDFWLLVQHCDFDPEFQLKVLEAMKVEIENDNADKRSYAYLIDRVNKNLGKKLIYGTQVTYNRFGQAIPYPLEDSINVNARRADVGLEPLEDYLNRMTISHFEMNKENMIKRGFTEPKLWPTTSE